MRSPKALFKNMKFKEGLNKKLEFYLILLLLTNLNIKWKWNIPNKGQQYYDNILFHKLANIRDCFHDMCRFSLKSLKLTTAQFIRVVVTVKCYIITTFLDINTFLFILTLILISTTSSYMESKHGKIIKQLLFMNKLFIDIETNHHYKLQLYGNNTLTVIYKQKYCKKLKIKVTVQALIPLPLPLFSRRNKRTNKQA